MTAQLLAAIVLVEAVLVAALVLVQLRHAAAGPQRLRREEARSAARAALIGAVVSDNVDAEALESLDALSGPDRDAVVCQVAVEVRSQSDPVFAEIAEHVGTRERIERDLSSRRWWVRLAALRRARALGIAPAGGVGLLDDPDARVRAAVVAWIAAVQPVADPAHAIVPLLADPADRVRHAAMTALYELGSSAQAALLDQLQEPDDRILDATIATAAALGDPVLAGAVRPFATCEDPVIQAQAIHALGPVLTDDDAELVAELLSNDDPRVRAAAAEAAGAARLQGVAGDLARNLSSEDAHVREAAIGALGRIGPGGELLLRRRMRLVGPDHG